MRAFFKKNIGKTIYMSYYGQCLTCYEQEKLDGFKVENEWHAEYLFEDYIQKRESKCPIIYTEDISTAKKWESWGYYQIRRLTA